MKSYVMGVDFGSTTAKTVILNLKGEVVASNVAHMGAVSGEGVEASVEGALKEAGLTQDDIAVRVIRDMIFGAIEHQTWAFLRGEGDFSVDESAGAIADIISRGLAPAARAGGDLDALADKLKVVADQLNTSIARLKP